MSGEVRSAISLLIGIVTLRVALSSLMLNYVRPAMRPWLIASGAVLCFLGVVGFLRATRPHRDHDEGHHDHPPSKAAWLLLLPVLAASLMTPQALGSFAADRQATVRAEPGQDFGPLPRPVDGAVELTLTEFNNRAIADTKQSLKGKTVRLIGFVSAADPDSDAGFVLNRFAISCCAADARAMQVTVDALTAPRPNAWVEVTGRWKPTPASGDIYAVPVLVGKELNTIKQPEVPYE